MTKLNVKMIGIKKIVFKVNSNITENLDKIQKCLNHLLPAKVIQENHTINEVTGIYGNIIKILNIEVVNNTIISQILI